MQQPPSAEPSHPYEYNLMKKFTIIAALLLAFVNLSAQTDKFEQRYNLVASRLGVAGVGIETILDNWAQADSTNEKLLKAQFEYYFTKSQRTEVVKKSTNKYLGMNPVLTLKDSLGQNVYYYQETFYDDELFGQALKAADKAANLYPDKLDYKFLRVNALIAYEKESPDMALTYLLELAQADAARKNPWQYEGEKAEDTFFEEAMQEYCYSFYYIGSPEARETFYTLSKKMNELHPNNYNYVNNIGTYYMVVKEDYKTALKYYNKVLKKNPSDAVALQNCVIAARKSGNTKLETKYRNQYNALSADKK